MRWPLSRFARLLAVQIRETFGSTLSSRQGIQRIGEGPSEVQKHVIARDILGAGLR